MKKYLLITLLLITIYWLGSIVRCEIVTKQHGDEFMMFQEVSTASKFKILTYEDDFARIYCVNFNESNGSIHNFIKEDGIWKYNAWEGGGWSKSGSADGFIWPYIR